MKGSLRDSANKGSFGSGSSPPSSAAPGYIKLRMYTALLNIAIHIIKMMKKSLMSFKVSEIIVT
jgi:hypothetical protein